MRSVYAAILLLITVSACDEEFDSDELLAGDELTERAAEPRHLSTYYDNAKISRTVFVVGAPVGTYNAYITSKHVGGDKCAPNESHIMAPVPPKEVTFEICAGLNLLFKAGVGGLNGCYVSHSAPSPTPVYSYRYGVWPLRHQLNYRVVDVGAGVLLGDSGWQPQLDNECPRDGFPYP